MQISPNLLEEGNVADQPEPWSWQLPKAARDGSADDSPATGTTPTGSGRRALHPDDDFHRTVAYTVAGTVLPGLGLIAARRRLVGGVILALFVGLVATIGVWALVDLQGLASVAVRPAALHVLIVAFILLALVWVAVIVVSHLSLRGRANRRQRLIGGVLVGALAFAVAAPMAVAARYSFDQANLVNTVFKSDKNSKSATRPTLKAPQAGQTQGADPWAGMPRLNVLLLGGDAGKGRVGTRTDTVILASIDTKTGDTTLFSLPRNTANMPFPQASPLRLYYPNGFTTPGNGNGQNAEFFLNAMYRNVPNSVPKNVLGETDDLGADALKLSVGAALGLKVDYYALINLQGFQKMINALGGITLNINSYIPIGGNTDRHIPPDDYLHPGKSQHLNGRSTLWYARGRYGSTDYARMDRQRCVINAIIDQANPANMLARYEKIAKAGGEIIYTDMPQEVLPLMVDLSLRVKNGNTRSIVFKTGSDGFVSANPNFAQMRTRVKAAIGEATSRPGPTAKKKQTKAKAPESENVADACAYDPKLAASAQRPR